MKTQQVFILGGLIIALCLISLIPFSNIEGYNSYNDYYADLNNSTIRQENAINQYAQNQNAKTKGNANASDGTIEGIFKRNYTISVKNNGDFMKALNSALSAPPNPANDRVAIYNLQGSLSSLTTQNAATLLGEIGNPNNLNNPRLFLQYINWYCSNCPVDADTCYNLK